MSSTMRTLVMCAAILTAHAVAVDTSCLQQWGQVYSTTHHNRTIPHSYTMCLYVGTNCTVISPPACLLSILNVNATTEYVLDSNNCNDSTKSCLTYLDYSTTTTTVIASTASANEATAISPAGGILLIGVIVIISVSVMMSCRKQSQSPESDHHEPPYRNKIHSTYSFKPHSTHTNIF